MNQLLESKQHVRTNKKEVKLTLEWLTNPHGNQVDAIDVDYDCEIDYENHNHKVNHKGCNQKEI